VIETDDFLADLEAHPRAAAQREPHRRRRRPRTVPIALAAVVVVVLVVVVTRPAPEIAATPAATATPGGDARAGVALAGRAVRATAKVPACRPAGPQPLALVAGRPLPAITAALPALAAPAGDALPRSRIAGGRVLRSTVHRVTFPDGVRATVYVALGTAQLVADPGACRQARIDLVMTSASGEERLDALASLAARLDTAEDAQSLWIVYERTGGSSAGGVGLPIRPGDHVPTGIVGSGGSPRLYAGIARPGAASVRVGARTFPVRDGLYVVTGPIGRAGVQELDAAGRVLR
jgi:hypothetical protein